MSQEELPRYYTLLFNGVTKALEQLENQQPFLAKETLIRAQQQAEACYIEDDDT